MYEYLPNSLLELVTEVNSILSLSAASRKHVYRHISSQCSSTSFGLRPVYNFQHFVFS